jgi:dynein heavy chain
MEQLRDHFDKYVPACIDFVLEGLIMNELTKPLLQTIPLTNLNMARQLCTMLEVILSGEMTIRQAPALEALFIYCVIWSIGGSIVQTTIVKDRDRFDGFVKMLAGLGTSPNQPLPPNQLPANLIYEYHFDVDALIWRSWEALVPTYEPPPDGAFAKILVPTLDTCRSTWIIDTLAKTDYGPSLKRRMIVFMDDMNMPKVDTYGTQQLIAMLKLLVEKGGIYDRGHVNLYGISLLYTIGRI